ncbi:MAG: hypothetical protein EA398_05385 [Deltaproteobacteria bacterium]|nr:MAG: hypothetical protein EA398_05385 [Deltaproteobacteria bacterium]
MHVPLATSRAPTGTTPLRRRTASRPAALLVAALLALALPACADSDDADLASGPVGTSAGTHAPAATQSHDSPGSPATRGQESPSRPGADSTPAGAGTGESATDPPPQSLDPSAPGSPSGATEPSPGEPSSGGPGTPGGGSGVPEPTAGEPTAGQPTAAEPTSGVSSEAPMSGGEPTAGEPTDVEPSSPVPSASLPPVPGDPYAMVSAAELELYELIMTYRAENGLPRVPLSPSLTRVAQLHVEDLNRHGAEVLSDECNLHSWSSQGPWTACCYTRNHAQRTCMWNKPRELTDYPGNGYEISVGTTGVMTPSWALQLWQSSEGHRNVILNVGDWSPAWGAIGVGLDGRYGHVWFGREADPALSR